MSTSASVAEAAVVTSTSATVVVETSATVSSAVVAMVVAVAHAMVAVMTSEGASVIPTASAVAVPTVATAIDGVEVWASEVEEVAVGIAGVDAEVPIASLPVEWTIEICGCQIGLILPIEQDITQVEVALCPICTIEVGLCVHAHQVVEVHLEGGLILLLGEVQFIGHLIGKEQRLLTGLLITHGIDGRAHGDQHCKGDKQSFHCSMFLCVITLFLFSRCKIANKKRSMKRIFPTLRGDFPYFRFEV